MDQRKVPWYLNVWLRVGLFIPGLYVLPWALLALALAPGPDTDVGDVAWGFYVIPLASIVAAIRTIVFTVGRPLPGEDKALAILLGLFACACAFVLGMVIWFRAAVIACHGGYECPF
jgi:hypothetical protein